MNLSRINFIARFKCWFFLLLFKLGLTVLKVLLPHCNSETGTELLKSLSRKDARWKRSLNSNQGAATVWSFLGIGMECFESVKFSLFVEVFLNRGRESVIVHGHLYL